MKTEFSEKTFDEINCTDLFLADISSHKLLTAAEETALGRRIAEGDISARNELCDANYRLVIKLAKNFTYTGMELEDLIQAGNMGLLKAAEKYDYTLGFKFSTYATTWILQSIRRSIADNGRTIRVPVHMLEAVAKQNKVVRDLTQKFGRAPSVDEIAEATGCTAEKVLAISSVTPDMVSLDEPTGEDDDSDWYSFVPDKGERPEDAIIRESLHGEIEKALSSLTEREAEVVRLRHGLADGEIHTLENIARQYGITRERVRQIEALALRKLKYSPEARALKEYLAA